MDRDHVRARLATPFHEGLLRRTYESIRDRLEPDGYFPESLTGTYAGMFPRTCGPLARLLMDTGESAMAERAIHYCIQGMLDNGLDRIPHVIDRRDASGRIPLRCDEDQVDGQAHIIQAWALLAEQRGRTPYEDLSYPCVADLLDRATRSPYFLPGPTGGRDLPGLVRNPNLEHSRDAHFWDAYDLLTQSFVAAALERMIPIATRRSDTRHAHDWAATLARLNANVDTHMTRQFEGRRIYLELRLPTAGATEPFPGLGWINLAPVAADWQSVDPVILDHTIATWRRVARIDWSGPTAVACEWLPQGHTDAQGRRQFDAVIGKALGWDMLYAMRHDQHDYLCQTLDFLEQVNHHALFAEAFRYDAATGQWHLNDPGNGEQACWWVWAMMRVRTQAGLTRLPAPRSAL